MSRQVLPCGLREQTSLIEMHSSFPQVTEKTFPVPGTDCDEVCPLPSVIEALQPHETPPALRHLAKLRDAGGLVGGVGIHNFRRVSGKLRNVAPYS